MCGHRWLSAVTISSLFGFLGQILSRVGTVAYKLELPPSAAIHPVVHVSQLKKHIPPGTEVLDTLHVVATDPSAQIVPVQILSNRSIWRGGFMVQQVFVQWANQPPSMDSWEVEHDMRRCYHTAWGQAVAKGGGNVTAATMMASGSG
jgi:hypothetical protein